MRYNITYLALLIIQFTQIHAFTCESAADCHDHGSCSKPYDKICFCDYGWIGEDCSEAATENYIRLWNILQAITVILYFIAFVISGAGFWLAWKQNKALGLASTVRSAVLGGVALVCVLEVPCVLATPSHNTTSNVILLLLYSSSVPIGITIYGLLLFHWIDLIHSSIATLEKEHMLQQINSQYKGKEVTLEEMTDRVKFLSRLRVPWVFGMALYFTFTVICFTLTGLHTQGWLLDKIFYPIEGLVWVLMAIGFLTYGRKLVKLMPAQIVKKVRVLTVRLTLLSCFILAWTAVVFTTLSTVDISTAVGVFMNFFVVQFNIVVVCIATALVLTSPKKGFLHWGSSSSRTLDMQNRTSELTAVTIGEAET